MTLVEKNEDYDTQFDPEIAELRNMVSKNPSIKTKMWDIVKYDSWFSLVIEGIESARLLIDWEKYDWYIEWIYNVEELECLIWQTLFELCNENNKLSDVWISKEEFYDRFVERVSMVRLWVDIEDLFLYLLYSIWVGTSVDMERMLTWNQSLVLSNSRVYTMLSELIKWVKINNKGKLCWEWILKFPFWKWWEIAEYRVNFWEWSVWISNFDANSFWTVFDRISFWNIKSFVEYFITPQWDNSSIMIMKWKTLKFSERNKSDKFSIFDVWFDIDRLKESLQTAMNI